MDDRTSGAEDEFLVACVQMEPVVGERDRNLARSISFAEEAADAGAKLVVLPELCPSGYVFESMEEAQSLAEEVPGGPSVRAWETLCRDRDLHLVAGIAERAGEHLFNSSVVIGPDGFIGTFRKVHLWNRENLFFQPGDLGFPVFDTPLGRVATFICYDGWFPEAYRLCALQSADIICVPTNWVPMADQPESEAAMATTLTKANAHSNGVYIAAADRVGTERGQPFEGQSLIVNYAGWAIAGPASVTDEEIIYARVAPSLARAARRWNEFNDPIANRRPSVYDQEVWNAPVA